MNDVRHSFKLRERQVLALGKYQDVAQICHEGVGIPAEKPHALDISEPHRIENNVSTSNTQGMRGPKAQTFGISCWISIRSQT